MKHLALLLIITLLLWSCRSIGVSKGSSIGEYFEVEVVQDGKVVKERNNIIELEKKPFKYRLRFMKTDHVYVSNSWGTHYYGYPDTENIFECNEESAEGICDVCRFVSVKTGTEDRFNVGKDIYVGNKIYHGVWFYDEEIDWYRMDKGVFVKDEVVYADVTVENIYDLDKRDARKYEESEYAYPIERIEKDIYVVFATSRYESGMEQPEELQKEKFIIKFK